MYKHKKVTSRCECGLLACGCSGGGSVACCCWDKHGERGVLAAGAHTLRIPNQDIDFSHIQVEKGCQHDVLVPSRPYHVLKS